MHSEVMERNCCSNNSPDILVMERNVKDSKFAPIRATETGVGQAGMIFEMSQLKC